MLNIQLSLHSFLVHLLLFIEFYLLLKFQIVLPLLICLYINLIWFLSLSLLRISIYLLFLCFYHPLLEPFSPVLPLWWHFVCSWILSCSLVQQLAHQLICHRSFLILLLIVLLLLPLLLIQLLLPQLYFLNTLILVLAKPVEKVFCLRLWLPSDCLHSI